MAGFKSALIAMLLVGLFAFALFNFNVQLIEQNGGNTTLLDNPTINTSYSELNKSLSQTKNDFQSQSSILANTPVLGTFTILLTSLQGAWTVFIKVPQALFTTLFSLINIELFGGSPLFNVALLTISAIFIFVITVYAIKFLRIGDPD